MTGGQKLEVGRSWVVVIAVSALIVAALAATPTEQTDESTVAIEERQLDSPSAPQGRSDALGGSVRVTNVSTAAPASTSASATPSTPAAITEPERSRLIINAVGDVNVDPGYIPALLTEGYDHALSGMGGLFLDDDLTIINLECPASELGTIVPKEFNFRCDVAALESLRRLGVDVANQGNNHILDYGPEAMLDSLEQLRLAGIAPVGAGANAAEAAAPAVFERNGWTIAVIGFGGVVPGGSWIAADDRPGMADGDTIETMVDAVEAADAIADLVVVTIHWGVELQSGPPAGDVRRAEAMIAAGADMIFGHHPHRLNALEFHGDRPVSWSLGNFVWPRLSAAGSDTAVAQVIVEPDGRFIACHLEATIVSDGHPELDDPAIRTCLALPET